MEELIINGVMGHGNHAQCSCQQVARIISLDFLAGSPNTINLLLQFNCKRRETFFTASLESVFQKKG